MYIKFINKLGDDLSEMDFIIICSPMSQYEIIFNKINKTLSSHTVITEVGSTKRNLLKFTKKKI